MRSTKAKYLTIGIELFLIIFYSWFFVFRAFSSQEGLSYVEA